MRRSRGLVSRARAAIAMLKTCKRINYCTCRPENGCQCSHPRTGKRRRHVTLTGSPVIVLSPRSPILGYGIWNRYGRVVSSRGEVGGHSLDVRKPNQPHAPRGFPKELTLESFGSIGRRQRYLDFPILCPCINNLARWKFWLAAICLALQSAMRLRKYRFVHAHPRLSSRRDSPL